MSSRNFDLSQAAADFVTVLPDLNILPAPGYVLSADTVSGGRVKTKFNPPDGAGVFLPFAGGTLTGPLTIMQPTGVALAINRNTVAPPVIPGSVAAYLVGADGGLANLGIFSFGNTSTLTFYGAAGTLGAATAPLLNAVIGSVSASGWNGTAWSSVATMVVSPDENWGATNNGARWHWQVTPIGSNARIDALTLRGSGNLIISTSQADRGYKLDINGTTRIDMGAAGLVGFPAAITGGLQIGAADAAPGLMSVIGFGNNSTPSYQFWRSSGTRAAPTAVASAAALGQLVWFGYGATGYAATPRALIAANASQAWTDAAQGTDLAFSVTPLGSIVPAVLMRLWGSGNLILSTNTTDTGNRLDVTGSTRLNGTVGFQGAAPLAKPTISGAKASNAALASLLTALVNYGLITDSTTA